MAKQAVRQRGQAEPRASGIGFRGFAHHRGEDAVQFRARLVQGHAALQPAQKAQSLAVAAGRKRIDPLRVVHFGNRCGRGLEQRQKRGRQYAHHFHRTAGEPEHAAQDVRVAAEPAHPQGVAEDDREALIGRLVGRQEVAAEFDLRAHRIEEVGIHA